MIVQVPLGEAFRYGWEAFRRNVFFFIGLLLIAGLPLALLEGWAGSLPDRSLQGAVIEIFAALFRVAVAMAVIVTCLGIYDRGLASPSEFRRIGNRYIPYFFGTMLYSLLVGIGMVLLVVPGVYVGVACQFAPYLIIDRRLGPVEALRESAALTKGSRWGLLFFGLVMIGLNILGSLLFGLGLLITVPVTFSAHVWVYRRFVPAVI
ncbi:MAG: DUF975 family protein [Thermovirgaceae bacterium]